MLAALKTSFALKLATAAAATAAVAGVADATDAISLDSLFSGSSSTAVESGIDTSVDGDVGVGADNGGATVTGTVDLGVGLD